MEKKRFFTIKRLISMEEKQERLKVYNQFRTPFDPPVDPIEFMSREIFDETIHLKCTKCNYDEITDYEIIKEITYGMEYPMLSCPRCSHTKENGTLVPLDIFNSDFK